jgi:hypothetical protein
MDYMYKNFWQSKAVCKSGGHYYYNATEISKNTNTYSLLDYKCESVCVSALSDT